MNRENAAPLFSHPVDDIWHPRNGVDEIVSPLARSASTVPGARGRFTLG